MTNPNIKNESKIQNLKSKIRRGFVETSGGQIHYRTAGRETAPAILLLHQTASSSVMYEKLMAQLADSYFLFAPDTPGFGDSYFPPAPATVKLYADVLHEATKNFNLPLPCFVFGHHTGASIAVQMEFDRQIATKMILSGPPYLSVEQKEMLRRKVEPINIKADGSHLLRLWQRLRAKDETADLSLTQREFLLNLHAGERYTEAYFAVFNHDFENQLARLECPILVMAGDQDTLKDSLEPAFQALKNGERRRIQGNTYICDRAPGVIKQVVREYFE